MCKWAAVPDVWEGQVEEQSQMWKNAHFPMRFLFSLSQTHQNTLLYTCFDQTHPPPISKINKKVPKTVFFLQISNCSLIFDPLPLPIFRLSLTFCCTLPSGHHKSWISQNFVFKDYIYPRLWRKNFWGDQLTHPPPWYKKD